MTQIELQNRTKKFAIDVIKLTDGLPNKQIGWTITNQIVRSSTSVAANYRAACRARSDKEFIAKLGIVVEESDESLFWLELIKESELQINSGKLEILLTEADELTAIFVSSIKTVKNRSRN